MDDTINILVLDDNIDDREFIENVIKDLYIAQGMYNLFSTKEEMFKYLGVSIHIVILDHLLEGESAFPVFQEIRIRNEGTFIIISTAYDDADTILMYMNNDADRFASKRDYKKWTEDLKKFLIKGFEVAKRNVELIDFLKKEKSENDKRAN